MRYYHYCITQ